MSIRPSAHPRVSWAVFGATCVLALGAALVASLASGGRTSIGLTFLGGVVVIGIAAALMGAIVSPMSDGDAASSGLSGRGGWGEGGGVGLGGDGGGGGDCGG